MYYNHLKTLIHNERSHKGKKRNKNNVLYYRSSSPYSDIKGTRIILIGTSHSRKLSISGMSSFVMKGHYEAV